MNSDIRWLQRFQNFDRAFVLLRSAIDENSVKSLNQLELEGVIQRFEYCYELAWKTMKDYLQESGLNINPITPRNVIKEAFSTKLISDGQIWIDIMNHRNLLSHTYDFKEFESVLTAIIDKYIYAFSDLHDKLLQLKMEYEN